MRRRCGRFGNGSLAAALVVAVLATVSTPAASTSGFGDVDANAFSTDAVQWMVDNAITTGMSVTCFAPDEPVTRGEAAALWRESRRSSVFGRRRSVVETTGPSPKVVDAHDAAARPSTRTRTRTRNGVAPTARTAARRGGSRRSTAALGSGDALGTGCGGRRVR